MMRRMKTMLLIAIVAISASGVWATGNLKVNIISDKEDIAKVLVTNLNDTNFEFEVKNINGDLLYYKQTKTPSKSFTKTFDFTLLRDGRYTFTAKLDNEKVVSTINIDNGNITVIDERKNVKPFFKLYDNRFELSYLNFEMEKMKLFIYESGTDNLLHEKDIEPSFAVHQGLDLSELRRGNYDAVLVGEHHFYEYNLELD